MPRAAPSNSPATAEAASREVVLRPVVHISAGDPALAASLHREANEKCFIAASVDFPVRHEPAILVLDDPRS